MEKDWVKLRESWGFVLFCFLCWIKSAFGKVFLKRHLRLPGGILTGTTTATPVDGCPLGWPASRAKDKSPGRLRCYKRTGLGGLREGRWAWFSRRRDARLHGTWGERQKLRRQE